ncbi:hypothetical protein GGR54DRAFT_90723 [Hypoxylon sp. NC1633]|nr:hypothetical protein GGR54DRAFT_90723 [Hypoxylon sp. NC1633]
MAPARLARPPTCLGCLRRLAQPTPSPSMLPSFLSLTQTRGLRGRTKAEEEDLQGIAVRLLRDIKAFGRKHAIIRVKPGRMRNYWFPRAAAEYMTRQRFKELGLTEAAVGVRDRTFGVQLLVDKNADGKSVLAEKGAKKSKKEVLTLPPEETLTLLQSLLPSTLTFARKPIPAAPAPSDSQPTPTPRSPSLATNAITSAPEPAAAASAPTAIFGSVSATDVLALVKESLTADRSQGGRVALEADGVAILGLDEGEDRIKRLGTFEVLITVSKDLEPVRREVRVVAEE